MLCSWCNDDLGGAATRWWHGRRGGAAVPAEDEVEATDGDDGEVEVAMKGRSELEKVAEEAG